MLQSETGFNQHRILNVYFTTNNRATRSNNVLIEYCKKNKYKNKCAYILD